MPSINVFDVILVVSIIVALYMGLPWAARHIRHEPTEERHKHL